MSDDPRRVERWMSKDLLTTSPDALLADALEQMEGRRIRHLPVIHDDLLVGLLSDRDARRSLDLKDSANATVRAVMTAAAELRKVQPGTLVRDAAELICREKISSLPVVQGDQLVGIVTSEDLLWAFLDKPE